VKAAPALCLLALACGASSAAVPPVLRYRTADGLPTNQVTALLHDHLGFLWVGTADGLARFDGDRFEVFGTGDGLPAGDVTGLVETQEGTLYVATAGGVAELDDAATKGAPAFRAVAPFAATADVHGIALDARGRLVIATHQGLFTLDPHARPWQWRPAHPGIPVRPGLPPSCAFVSADSREEIWSQCADVLLRISLDGRLDSWTMSELHVPPGTWVMGVGRDPLGRTWLAGSGFLYRLVPEPRSGEPIVARDYSGCFGQPGLRFYSLLRTRDGKFWAAGNGGPFAVDLAHPEAPCPFTPLLQEGIAEENVTFALTDDEEGNLWFSDGWYGLARLARSGFTFFDRRDGLRIREVASLGETRKGEVLVGPNPGLQVLRGGRFLPGGRGPYDAGWGNGQRFLVDRDGRAWIGTRQGLMRQENGAWQHVGPSGVAVMRVFEDGRGDLWFGPDRGFEDPLCRIARSTEEVRCFGPPDGVPKEASLVRSMAEDAAGNLWFGFREGQLLRFRDGRFRRFGREDGFQADEIYTVLPAGEDRLWIAVPRKGVYRVEGGSTDRPRFSLLDGRAGLSSLDLRTLVADARGRIYAGSTRGIDRIDPATGHVHRYTERDGLLNTYVSSSFRTLDGSLWFGTAGGAARLLPEADPPRRAPRVHLMGVRVAGVATPLPPRGIERLDGLSLTSNQRNLEVRFTAVSNRSGERLRFETRLTPGQPGWSEPGEARTVSLAGLAPGDYRFEVRALSADGTRSEVPAAVRFTVAAPIWMRGWFLALAAAAAAALVVLFVRQRTARLLALERQRTRLAMDLHDDVGSSLSQIALQSELALARLERGHGVPPGTLERISGQAREVVDAMGDVVWSVDPSRDDLADLVRRMRAFALDAVGTADVRLTLQLPPPEASMPLNANLRRQLYLVFKEALSNALRHAHATGIEVALSREGDRLRLRVEDDGVGAGAESSEMGGHGLGSMRQRAAQCGGTLRIEQPPGGGTRVTLEAPLQEVRPRRAS